MTSPVLAAAGNSSPYTSQASHLDVSNASSNTVAYPDALSDQELEVDPQDFQQVPEAHPFDLNFENLAGAVPGSLKARPSVETEKGKRPSTPKLLNKLKKRDSSSSSNLATSPVGSINQLAQHQGGRETPSQMRCVIQKVYFKGCSPPTHILHASLQP